MFYLHQNFRYATFKFAFAQRQNLEMEERLSRPSRVQESGLKLAEVVEFIGKPWEKLKSISRFSKFHAKFWGKCMEDEEQEWLDLNANSRDDSADEDAIMDDGDNEDTGDGDDEGTGDTDTDTDEDDELIPGCYELDISPNPVSDVSKIWIRADYIRVYEYAEARYDLCYRRKAQAVVVTGPPGIGKTVWLLYALRRRCAEKKPVIWYDGLDGYIFVDDGVYQMTTDFHANEFKVFVWTLVDSDQAKDGVPPELVRNRTRLFVNYATSPNKQRWQRLHKTVEDATVVMNPWSWKEIIRAVPILLSDEQFTVAEIKRAFEQLGPTPRITQLLSDPARFKEYKQAVDIAISDITSDKLKKMVSDTRSLASATDKATDQATDISSKLCLVSRTKRDDVHSAPIVAPITEAIKSRLASQLRRLSRNQQIELYNLFARVPQTRKMSGTLFEAIGQDVLPEGLNITLLPMVRLTRKPNAKSRPRWYSSHTSLSNKTLEAKPQEAQLQSQMIQIPPTTTQEFNANGALSFSERVFYVPISDNQEALNAFLLLNGILYIFQFTVGKRHSIKPGFVEFFRKCRHVPPMEKWKFVFVIPPGLTLMCPEPKSQLCDLNPYTAELDVQQYMN